jgi:hypothetical protein
MAKSYADRFVIVQTTLQTPSPRKRNKKMESDAAVQQGIVDSSRVGVTVDYFNTPELQQLNKHKNRIRNQSLRGTAPWGTEKGCRLMHNSQVRPFKDFVAKEKLEADRIWQGVKDSIHAQRDRDRTDLGSAFDESKYPTDAELDEKYVIEVTYRTVPDSEKDQRAAWDDEFRKDWEKETIETERRRTAKVMHTVVGRMHSCVGRVADRMKKYDGSKEGSWRDNFFSNVKDIVEISRTFNIGDDPQVEEWINEMTSSIAVLDPQALRESEEQRQELAAVADNLVEKMERSKFMNLGGFGEPELPAD